MATDEENRRQEWKDHYDHLRATHRSQASSLNQLIFAISGGTLGWSIAYMEKISDSPPKCFWLVQLCWVLLIISIVSLGISLWASVSVLGQALAQDFEAGVKSKLNSLIPYLNVVFTYSALLGLVCFGLFGMFNTEHVRNPQMSNKSQSFIDSHHGPLAIDSRPDPWASVQIGKPPSYSPQPSENSQQPAAPPPPPPAAPENSGK